MSPEIIAIIGTGMALAGLILRQGMRIDRLEQRIDRLDQGQADLRERMAKLEGLLEGLREAIAGRPPPAPSGAD